MTILSFGSGLAPAQVEARDITPTLQRPLIVGASVSAGYAAPGPGTLLSTRYTDAKNIRTIAANGTPAHVVLKRVPESLIKDRSVIIGVDLFFWDSIYPTGPASLSALQKLVAEAERAQIPLVLGDIPQLLPGLQWQRQQLNNELRAVCARSKQCYLVPLSGLFEELLRDRSLVYQSQRYSLRELLPDGIHLGPVASTIVADLIEQTLRS